MFASSSLLNLNSSDCTVASLVVSYGRVNPSKIFATMLRLNEAPSSEKPLDISIEELKNVKDNADVVEWARFRHSSCSSGDHSAVYIYGGKRFDEAANVTVTLGGHMLVLDKSNGLRKVQV